MSSTLQPLHIKQHGQRHQQPLQHNNSRTPAAPQQRPQPLTRQSGGRHAHTARPSMRLKSERLSRHAQLHAAAAAAAHIAERAARAAQLR